MTIQDFGINTAEVYPVTDSRQVLSPTQNGAAEPVFFAIQGEHHDGHRFITELYKKNVRQFVVETAALTPDLRHELAQLPDARIHEVGSSLKTLQEFAAEHRSRFMIPVVGITGSNGKTIVKEWLAQVLSPDFRIQKSPKSYNSQLGVPLSVWPLNENHTLGIFEAGISKPAEMQALQSIINPTIGIFTNIGPAHDEGFRSQKQKVAEKLRLFRKAETLIYRKSYSEIDEEIHLLLKAVNPTIRLISWSTDPTAAVPVSYIPQTIGTQISVRWEGRDYGVEVPFSDLASLENATHVLLATLVLGVMDVNLLRERFARLRPVSMRLELKEGIHRNLLIDDTYNNDLAGLSIALDFLNQQDASRPKVLVLSDLLETGMKPDELYPAIARMVAEKNISQLVGVGPEMGRYQSIFTVPNRFYPTTNALLQSGYLNELTDSVILVKGARRFSFESVVSRFVQKSHRTVLEINLDALTHNLNFYRSKVGSQTKIMVMVKAFAYGSGSAEVASLLQYHRVDYLAVAYADEGVGLRQNGITLPILVMNPAPESFRQLLDYNLEPEIFSFRILDEWRQFLNEECPQPGAEKPVVKYPTIHIKLDTGMHRLGFLPGEIADLGAVLTANPDLRVASVFSHLAGSDDAEHTAFSQKQYRHLIEGATQLEQMLGYRPLRHLLNSAGIVRLPDYKLDMVRLGIGLYGVEVSKLEPQQVQAVGTLKTIISQIKDLKAGETVGYSRRGVLTRDARIATLAVGYADGYDRRLGNGVGQVWVHGVLCPTVGSVCMDMTMIDISETQAEEGDEVILFGQSVSIADLAERIGTIPYEILTGVSERVKRVFYRE
ncbi:bifunctional UDP-N-acetylmuramoyl-tripeptide:D-alanyl-D-alanine ligase/alanine racemase [Larkinella humicola]|uniref:Alanine racemase n=1 Tax=Larkinella humicola TaxID=2607654 RepID=A0A5N1JN17_9BACT|nr:bifunctional UDP-N-acetylmuramoyl-tripeptide:D-alanyl-D-alanine ligase/alanine racemase [Larkinella humicola]KAA9357541.1 bifunctional UDP-N-acetylmuramoyl-tripeptide:D-alanyl-D-alanine ligase/alanine racemase [Larkinella humicola]